MKTKQLIQLLNEEITHEHNDFMFSTIRTRGAYEQIKKIFHLERFFNNLTYELGRLKIAAHYGKINEFSTRDVDDIYLLLRQLSNYNKSMFAGNEINMEYLGNYICIGNEIIKLIKHCAQQLNLDNFILSIFRNRNDGNINLRFFHAN